MEATKALTWSDAGIHGEISPWASDGSPSSYKRPMALVYIFTPGCAFVSCVGCDQFHITSHTMKFFTLGDNVQESFVVSETALDQTMYLISPY